MPDNVAAAPLPASQDAPAVRASIHALRPGTWPASPADITVTDEDIAATAAAYDAARYRAPVVIGHPETDSPAWGWVLDAEARADGLWLVVDLDPELAELVRERRYGAVSLALWTPQAPGNPAPGAWSIKHLGFLGAVPPAVKGLARVQLAEGEASCFGTAADAVSITLAERATPTRKANPRSPSTPTETHMPESAHDVQLAERERQLTEREQRLAEHERTLRRTQYSAELEPHIAATRVLAAERGELVELMERLADCDPVTLSEGTTKGALDTFRGFLARLAPRVDLRTLSADERRQQTGGVVPPVKLPSGMRISEAGQALHERATAYLAEHPGTEYLAAVRAVEQA